MVAISVRVLSVKLKSSLCVKSFCFYFPPSVFVGKFIEMRVFEENRIYEEKRLELAIWES
jgi:hypothetical protein